MKFVFLNGELVPSEAGTISVFDRGFLYGDGLFETLRLTGGEPWFWDQHWRRLSRGAEVLRIGLRYDSIALRKHAGKVIEANQCADGVLRIHLSRGVGPRGYSPRDANSPVLLMSTHPLSPAPESWKLVTTAVRLPALNPLSALKTANKLLHILAKTEADERGADEGLLLSDSGDLAQGSCSNLFWIENNIVFTPPEETGILPGVTRAAVLDACKRMKIPVRQTTIFLEGLSDIASVFMTLSTFGLVEAASLDGRILPRSPLAKEIRAGIIES